MKPRKVLLTIETTTNYPLSMLRQLRNNLVYFGVSGSECVEERIHVEQIQVNVIQGAEQAGKQKRKGR